MANKTDEIVQQLVDLVKQKKSEIAKAEKPNWLTNCLFRYNPGSPVGVSIQVETDIDVLVAIVAFLKVQNDSFIQIVTEFGVDAKFKWGGHSYYEWKTDIQNRINKIQINKKKTELEGLEARLDKLISPEKRTEMELEEITKLLSK